MFISSLPWISGIGARWLLLSTFPRCRHKPGNQGTHACHTVDTWRKHSSRLGAAAESGLCFSSCVLTTRDTLQKRSATALPPCPPGPLSTSYLWHVLHQAAAGQSPAAPSSRLASSCRPGPFLPTEPCCLPSHHSAPAHCTPGDHGPPNQNAYCLGAGRISLLCGVEEISRKIFMENWAVIETPTAAPETRSAHAHRWTEKDVGRQWSP